MALASSRTGRAHKRQQTDVAGTYLKAPFLYIRCVRKIVEPRSAVGLGFMGLGQTMAGQYRADHSPSIKQSGMVILAAISAQA